MASSEDNSMDEDKEEEESDDDLEQKRVIAILQPQNRSDNTRDSQGRLRLKCVQINDPHTTEGEDQRAVVRTLRRWDCCFIRGEQTEPEDEGSEPDPDLAPVHLAIIQDILLDEGSRRVWVAVRWLYRADEVEAGILPPAWSPAEREQAVFFSTWDDLVDAAALLHPVKVWFLRSNAKEKGLLPMMQVPANEGAVAHLRRRPGFLCMRSYDHESKHPRLQDYPLKSNNETGRQIELDQGMREMVRHTREELRAIAARDAERYFK